MVSYAMKDTTVNSTPAYNNKKVGFVKPIYAMNLKETKDIYKIWIIKLQEELANLCPSGTPCTELHSECLICSLNYNCIYGTMYVANCSVLEHVDCIVCKKIYECIHIVIKFNNSLLALYIFVPLN